MACRLVDAAASPAAAYGACYKSEGTAAELVRMAELAAGDRVVTAARDGSVALTRILVNQHAKAEAMAAVITLETAAGRLSLTRDHALYIDGALAAAGEAKVGSRLVLAGGRTAVVERITEQRAEAATINPITDSGTPLGGGWRACACGGAPILIARLLEQSVSPAPLPAASCRAPSRRACRPTGTRCWSRSRRCPSAAAARGGDGRRARLGDVLSRVCC